MTISLIDYPAADQRIIGANSDNSVSIRDAAPVIASPIPTPIQLHPDGGFTADSAIVITQTAEIEVGALSTIKFSASVDGVIAIGDVVSVAGGNGNKVITGRTDSTHWTVDAAFAGAIAATAAVTLLYSAWQEMDFDPAAKIYLVSQLAAGAWKDTGGADYASTLTLQFSIDGVFAVGSNVVETLAAATALGTVESTEISDEIQKRCKYFRYAYDEGTGSPTTKIWLIGTRLGEV